jgi:hypothetical protein
MRWGWDSHRYINEHAVDYLPSEMSFFKDHQNYLREHAVDSDSDPLPGFYHYIDIDYYPEFFDGVLPHNMDSLVALYNLDIVQSNGTAPWIIEQWTDSLSALMAAGNWDEVWQIAAEVGHYVADTHQPLHLTLNYNGQLTGNNGIHSRYETSMINSRLPELVLPTDSSAYWPSVIDSVFSYIGELYPFVDSLMVADDLASDQDPNYGSTYYNILWEELEDLTTISVHKAIIDLASIWRTAWVDAGKPSPLPVGIPSTEDQYNPKTYVLADAYPNPFNPSTNIEFSLPKSGFVSVRILNLLGQEVDVLVSNKLSSGTYTYIWNASGFASGIYFYTLEVGDQILQTKKIILLK